MVARARLLGAARGGAGSFFDDDAATTLSRRSIFDVILGARAATSTASPEPQADSSRKRISWDKSSLRCDVDCIP
jgi:hypothetical protein